MYKKLVLSANIKPDIDENVWEALEWMSFGDDKIYPDIDHPLFGCPDIYNLFKKHFFRESLNKKPMVYRNKNVCYVEFDLEDKHDVINKFLDWIYHYIDKIVFGAVITEDQVKRLELKNV